MTMVLVVLWNRFPDAIKDAESTKQLRKVVKESGCVRLLAAQSAESFSHFVFFNFIMLINHFVWNKHADSSLFAAFYVPAESLLR